MDSSLEKEAATQSFIIERMQRLAVFSQNWPNAEAPLGTALSEFIPELCKVPYSYMFRDDPVAMAEGNMLVWEYLGVDLTTAPLDCYNFEGETAGAKIKFFEDHIPDFDRTDLFIKGKEDYDKIKFGGVDSGRVKYLIDYVKAMTKYTGIPELPLFSAPWSLACNLYGMENFILLTMTEPEEAHEILRRLCDDLILPFLYAVNNELPGHIYALILADAACMLPMITMDIIEEFVEPYAWRILEGARAACGNPDLPMVVGVWTDIHCLPTEEERNRYLKFLLRIGSFTGSRKGGISANGIGVDALGVEYYIDKANELDASLTIGFAPSLIDGGTPQEVFEKAKTYLLSGKRCVNPFNLQLVCIGGHTPPNNVYAVVQANRTYGKPGATADTLFEGTLELPPFEEFLKNKMRNNIEGYSFGWLPKSGYAHLADLVN